MALPFPFSQESDRAWFLATEHQRLAEIVDQEVADYLKKATHEFDTLKPLVRSGFDSLANYLKMRPLYYRGGWLCPKQQIFDQIMAPSEGANILGMPIGDGIHNVMLGVLNKMSAALTPEKIHRLRQQVFSIHGFVPRVQEGTTVLSNHAFGLALDLDPDWNPQIKTPKIAAAFRRATGIDFSQALIPPANPDGTIAWDKIGEIFKIIESASAKLRDWLQGIQPEFDRLDSELKDLEVKKKKAKKWADFAQAEAALVAARGEYNRRILSSEDFRAMIDLRSVFGKKTMQAWAVYGIQTIPVDLIKAFLESGARERLKPNWGGDFQHTKDIMHMDLDARTAIKPNRHAVGENLEELLRTPLPPRAFCGG